jgi:hypothetical protein
MWTINDIITAYRIFGKIRCGLSSLSSPTVPELAREFGLLDDAACYQDIDEADAHRLIQMLLHRDMAYNAEIMPLSRAVDLTDQFLSHFSLGTRYFSNGHWDLQSAKPTDDLIGRANPNWHPVTSATFDTGVLAIGPEQSGCLWVEDED